MTFALNLRAYTLLRNNMPNVVLVGEAKRRFDREQARKVITEMEQVPKKLLSEYFREATAHHCHKDYALIQEIERVTQQPWWTHAEKGETVTAFVVRAIKQLTSAKKVTNGIEVTSVKTMPLKLTVTGEKIVQELAKPMPKPTPLLTPVVKVSDKERVYKWWFANPSVSLSELYKLAPDTQEIVVKYWVQQWSKGEEKTLPNIAKNDSSWSIKKRVK